MKKIALALCLFPTLSFADLSVRFQEGAPKDRFVFENTGPCDLGPFRASLDLSASKAGLIFDTTASGAGVEVFQPLEVVAGGAYVQTPAAPIDGQSKLDLAFDRLPAGARFAFTIDVDDTLAQSESGQIIVRGGEISGAMVAVFVDEMQTAAAFSDAATALVKLGRCS